MFCGTNRHRFLWDHAAAGIDPPVGTYCQCGLMVIDINGFPIALDFPTGRCPRCNEPWDDHPRPKCPLRLEVG